MCPPSSCLDEATISAPGVINFLLSMMVETKGDIWKRGVKFYEVRSVYNTLLVANASGATGLSWGFLQKNGSV